MIGRGIEEAIAGFVVFLVVVTSIVTAALIFVVPWIWALLKPILRGWLA